MSSHEDTCSSLGKRRFTDNLSAVRLLDKTSADVGKQSAVLKPELGDPTADQSHSADRCLVKVGNGVEADEVTFLLRLELLHESRNLLVDPANLLFADLRDIVDFLEGSLILHLAIRNEDAGCDDGVLLALKEFVLVRELVKMLGSVDYIGATLHEVHKLLDLVVCVLERSSSLILVRIVLDPGEIPVLPVLGECHGGRELLAILEDILRSSNTAWIVSSLVVVGESSPFRSSIDDTRTNDEPTVGADDVTARKFLREVGWVDLAIWAKQNIA